MKPTPHDYQIQVKDFMLNTSHCGVFLDMGLGKTLISLMVLQQLYDTNQITGHTLIIAPNTIARSTWLDEINKWEFTFPYKSLIANAKGNKLTKKKRHELYVEALTASPTVYIINRDLIVDLVNFFIDRDYKPNGRYNYQQGWLFKNIIIDEFQSFKSYNSERFKALKFVEERGLIQRLIGLTGTPIPNGLMDLWSEIFLLDRGARLGINITTYRNSFFVVTKYANGIPVHYEPIYGAEQEIYRRIKDIVISMKNTALPLPPITYNTIYAHMDDNEMTDYKKLLRDKVLDINDVTTITVANAAVLRNKLTQMASGALYIPQDDDIYADNTTTVSRNLPIIQLKNGTEYAMIHKRKLEILENIINNNDSPILVAYHFKSDIDMIINHFNAGKNSKPVTIFDGSVEMIRDWNNGTIPVLLIQPASAGYGLNLQYGGHILVWYTIPDSLEQYLQCNTRIYRQGQTKPVIIHHIITSNTVDSKILRDLNAKNNTEQALLDSVDVTPSEQMLLLTSIQETLQDVGIDIPIEI